MMAMRRERESSVERDSRLQSAEPLRCGEECVKIAPQNPERKSCDCESLLAKISRMLDRICFCKSNLLSPDSYLVSNPMQKQLEASEFCLSARHNSIISSVLVS